jgi:hypothetical protein
MAKYRREFTEKKKIKWEKAKKGQGALDGYIPWLTTKDVPAGGRKHLILGNKVDREHHLFSDLERDIFYIFDFSSNITDIREQFPLNREDTLRISYDLGITHPKDPNTQVDIVMTTDFVLTLEDCGEIITIARTAKYFKDLADSSVLEKLEIERRYWAERNINWDIITERQINRTLVSNIDKVRSAYHIDRTDLFRDMSEISLERIKNELKSLLIGSTRIREVCNFFDDKHGLEPGSALRLAKYLIATKHICFDIRNQKLEFDKTLEIYIGNVHGGELKVI